MKTISYLLILALVAIASGSQVIDFGETAVNSIFKEKKNAIVLFYDGNGDEILNTLKTAASADSSDIVYTVVNKDKNQDHFKRFSEYLGVNVNETPVIVYLVEVNKKYVATAEDHTPEGIASFISRVESGEVQRTLKSAPEVENEERHVKTFVGSNYNRIILGDERQYLIKVYAPWCGHCKKIAPQFQAAAEALSSNPNVVLGDFDGTLNEVDGMEISGYPTLFWYPKNKSSGPIKYNGDREKDGIISWIKDHTEHEWVEPVEEAQPETEL